MTFKYDKYVRILFLIYYKFKSDGKTNFNLFFFLSIFTYLINGLNTISIKFYYW